MNQINVAAKKRPLGRVLNLDHVVEDLLNDHIISPDTANTILKHKLHAKQHPLISITECHAKNAKTGLVLSMESLTQWLATKVNMPYLRIDPLKIKLENVSHLVPHSYALRLNIIPVHVDEKELVICTAEPFVSDWIDELSPILKKKIVLKMSNPNTIKQLLNEYYVVQTAVNKIVKPVTNEKLIREGKVNELDKIIERNKLKKWAAEDSAIVQIVDWLLQYALNERASDIHLEPKRGMSHIRLRIDGKLRTVYKLDPEIMLSLISRIKILADLKIDEKRRPQDGGVKKLLENDVRLEMRIATVPTLHGEKMVIRLFDHKLSGKSLDQIGFDGSDLKKWREMINSSHGLLLVTGPTGSGKTTTLYSSLSEVANSEVNVCTIEDPIEMAVEDFNQVQVNKDISVTFANSIKAFLRQDPDIIMVGEIRDLETAEASIQASLTGHTVFSTVHTNTALATIIRLMDLGIPPYLLNASLIGVLAQRLVRKLCTHCKEKIETPVELWENLLRDHVVPTPSHVFKASGCSECKHTGYSGRICVYELVPMGNELKKLIKPGLHLAELEEKTKGMFKPFRINAAEKVLSGETSLEEMIKVAI
ncbi:MAG: GspE/PulE family protein [Bacteriovoracaceae bacterium]